MAYFRAFSMISCPRLSLGELRSTPCSLEAVLFTLFHARIAGEETCFFERSTEILGIILQERSRNAVTDCAGLAGNAAAGYAADNIKLFAGLGENQGLANDELQGFKAEIIIDIAVVDGDFAGALIKSYAGNGAFSSAGSVEERSIVIHNLLPPYSSQVSGF